MLELLTPAKAAFQHVSCGTGWMRLWYSLDLGRAKSATTYARLGGCLVEATQLFVSIPTYFRLGGA